MKAITAAISAIAMGLIVAGCVARAGPVEVELGGDSTAPQSPEEVSAMIQRMQPTKRHVMSANRALLWKASEEWLDAKFRGLQVANAREGQLETHPISLTSDGPLPARTQVSIAINDHPESPGTLVFEVLALEIAPILGALAEDGSEDYAWRLVGNVPDLEEEIASLILEHYSVLLEGGSPALPVPIGS